MNDGQEEMMLNRGRKWINLGDVPYPWVCPDCRSAHAIVGGKHPVDFNEHKIRCDCGFVPHDHQADSGELCPECLQHELDRTRELLSILREAFNHVESETMGELLGSGLQAVLSKYDDVVEGT